MAVAASRHSTRPRKDAHAPVPVHDPPTVTPSSSKPSSVWPSQSLSTASQTSSPPPDEHSAPSRAALHATTPPAQAPEPQGSPTRSETPPSTYAKSSSVSPSQSLSSWSQESSAPGSCPGRLPKSQTHAPAVHVARGTAVASAHTPTRGQIVSDPSTSCRSSSTSSSQSLSSRSQTSVPGVPCVALHTTAPPGLAVLQTNTPLRVQVPWPTVQAVFFVGQSSSTPSAQSSSMPLQTSVPGAPSTALHCVAVPSSRQSRKPNRWQAPVPALHDWYRSPNASSVVPSQSSSM